MRGPHDKAGRTKGGDCDRLPVSAWADNEAADSSLERVSLSERASERLFFCCFSIPNVHHHRIDILQALLNPNPNRSRTLGASETINKQPYCLLRLSLTRTNEHAPSSRVKRIDRLLLCLLTFLASRPVHTIAASGAF